MADGSSERHFLPDRIQPVLAATGVTPSHFSRVELERGRVETIRRSGGWKASLWTTNVCRQTLFIKDVRHSNPVYRWVFGRWLIWHESRMYRHVGNQHFVPRFVGKADADALVIELVNGTHLGKCGRSLLTAELFDRIGSSVSDLHALGIVHLDLRSRRNILVTDGGRPLLIDFGNALYIGRGWLSRRVLVPAIAWIDDSAIAKFRARDLHQSVSTGQGALDTLRRIIWPWPRMWRALGVNRGLKVSGRTKNAGR